MDYNQALDFIHGIARFGSKPGLRRVRLLLERMGNPQNKLRYVHVAGTNGKGSTCTMLSHALTRAGYKTGLYISPFILDFRERIQVDNQMISKEDLARSTTLVKGHWDALDAMGEPPTEFEVVVAVAVDYFVRAGCDIVILEVGMGGRFDATNIIHTPLVSAITNIGIDHTEFLGDTIEEIAMEKCGIIKPGGITVSYSHQIPPVLDVIREHCRQMDNPLYIGGEAEILSADITGSEMRYDDEAYRVPLAGAHQVRNAVTVLEVVKALRLSGMDLPYDAVYGGIASTTFPSRLEILGRHPLILLDGAHNLSGAKALAQSLSLLPPHRKVHAVLGILADKDVEGVLGAVLPRCASVSAVTTPSPRAMPATELAVHAQRYCPDSTVCNTLREGVASALARCGKEDVLLLFGSLYLASELRPIALELSNNV